MPKRISERKQWQALELLFRGKSFDAVATELGASKGWTVALWQNVRAGEFPELVGPGEVADAMRDVAVELRRRGGGPEQALAGSLLLRRLAELGVTPNQLADVVALIDQAAHPDFPREAIAPTVLRLLQLENRLGRPIGEVLDAAGSILAKASEAEARVARAGAQLAELETKIQESLDRAKRTREDLAHVKQVERRLRELGLDLQAAERTAGFLQACRQVRLDVARVRKLADLDKALSDAGLKPAEATPLLRETEDILALGYTVDCFRDLMTVLARSGLKPDRGLAVVHDAAVQSCELEEILARRKSEVASAEDALRRLDGAMQGLREEQGRLNREIEVRRDESTSLDEEMRRVAEEHETKLRSIQADKQKLEGECANFQKQVDTLQTERDLVAGMTSLLYTERDRLPIRFPRSLRDLADLLEGHVPAGSPWERLGFRGQGPLLEGLIQSKRADVRLQVDQAVSRTVRMDLVRRDRYEMARKEADDLMSRSATLYQNLKDKDVRIQQLERKASDLEAKLVRAERMSPPKP